MDKVTIPNFHLYNGNEIPALGFGTWLGLDERLEFKVWDAPKLIDAMMYAIDIGYRHFDTAHLYRMEPEVGFVINKKIREGVVQRDDIFVTTKVWQHNHRTDDAYASVKASLGRLGLDYIDLVLIHWPISIDTSGMDERIDYLETYRGLENALKNGLVKSIGVSNFNLRQLERLLAHCEIKPAVNQIQVTINLLEKELVSFCKSQDIQVVSYSSFGSLTRSYAIDAPPPKSDDPCLDELARKYNKTVTQLVLRFLYQRGIVTIPKSLTPNRILENASIFDFDIESSDVAILEKFDCGYRSDVPIFWQKYANYPFEKQETEFLGDVPESLLVWKNGANLDVD
ncbi:aldo-keto reductase AKR2E4-like [Pieris brassicae]|uniref:NADP-dependent oxidoreductase domain-containing protein n=1 Tax=Pieris brassicae TaxID=7116 RepID=A0A9P0XIW8_PIEBR|nr:aldo-keto reductase AKR2E4-like [Pieris brassicae]CAH4036804.1 unnamed protein product [Pieris brassicae]